MFKIKTNRGEIFSSEGESILEALQKHGFYLTASCGGKGSCGRCKVRLIEGKLKQTGFFGITEEEKSLGYVLACQSYPQTDIMIEIPEKLITVSEKISRAKIELIEAPFKQQPSLFDPLVKKATLQLKPPSIDDSIADFERIKVTVGREITISREIASYIADFLRENKWSVTVALNEKEILELIDTSTKIYAVAVDIGTTTCAATLIDLETGNIIETATSYNSQIAYGDDVITRIIYAIEHPEGLTVLRKSIVDDINALLNIFSKRHKEGKIVALSLAGNTIMTHIFWGINPEYIREEPYCPVLNHYPVWRASDAGLSVKPQIPVYSLPSVAGYVGGDIVAGVIASGMYLREDVCLFIDIGTNGEVVVGNKDWLVTASTSAGPCFEGSGISCGMRATKGAIEAFEYDKDSDSFKIKVIGAEEPIGICGSGMIDIVSELFLKGVIDQKGNLVKDSTKWIKVFDEARFIIDENCFITQSDIDNIIRAKAAIYAGVSTLLEEVGVSEKDISQVYIAGGFGEFLNIKKAISIGMLPNLEEKKFIFLGNTSLAGAILCLLSSNLRKKAEQIADQMTYIDLSRSKKFMDEYVSALFLPHTDIERFK